ncbi:MAG: AAA family ATPase [Saprospiraceae bacterium]|nr:AAA family ATPase [Saprospiraceae bacterium]
MLQKILMIYYPNKFFSIGASDALIDLANDIKLKNVELSPKNLVEINYECRNFFSAMPEFKDWHYEKLATLIWANYRKDQDDDASVNSEKIRYWLYAPGENAEMWDEFYNSGIIGLGWDKLGDLNNYKTKDEIVIKLQELEKTGSSKKNDATANFEFKNEMKVDDVVIVKTGRSELLGYGIIKSDYYFDDKRDYYKHCRKVEWKKKGNWKTDHSLALKTLTDITKYASEASNYDKYYERLLGTMNAKMNYKKDYTEWMNKVGSNDSNKTSSYVRAIEILSEISNSNLFEEDDITKLDLLYQDLLMEQRNEKGKYFYKDAPSYGNSGFYSASIKTYSDFLKDFLSKNKTMGKQNNTPALNSILFGPPGTGKTYNSVDKAVEIAAFDRYNPNNHKANKVIFDELKKSGQIEFVTFHQNYSYEDFMVGLKPDVENESLRFKSHKGIFYEITRRAKENYFASKAQTPLARSFDEVFIEIVKPVTEAGEEVEITMVSGVKYRITDVSDTTIHFAKPSGGTQHTLSIQTLEDLVNDIKEVTSGLSVYYYPLANLIKEKRKPPQGSKKESEKNFVLVIDEINRANISKVFGELITLLEDDKRLGGDNELKVTLPNGEKEFGVPPNLYLIGTMNTADKSIALIDIALRRRFEFIGYYPKYSGYNPDAIELLQKINDAILKENKSIDYLIGHAYFMKDEKIKTVLEKKVVPLLMEYFSGKTEIVSRIFAETSWNVTYDLTNFNWDISLK